MPEDPTEFFTNVAARLLLSDLGLPLTQIEIYPTNQYSPAVHRLLQLTANLYDATTNRLPLMSGTNQLQAPTVFRPIFRRNPGPDATNVFIAGYREVTAIRPVLPQLIGSNPQFPMVDLEDAADRDRILPSGIPFQDDPGELMVSGIPLVIGARKGFPGFNKFALENAATVTRRLTFHRDLGASILSRTNQMFSLAITNSFGVQVWNSYSNDFMRPLTMIVAGDVALALTNEFGAIFGPDSRPLTNAARFLVTTNFAVWSGFLGAYAASNTVSFVVPMLTNWVFLSNSAFLHYQNCFYGTATNDSPNYFPVPHWWLSLKTRVRFLLADSDSRRIFDYVNLCSSENPLNIMELIRANAPCNGDLPTDREPDPGCLWCTNRLGNPNGLPAIDNPYLPTYGIMNQIEISVGLPRIVSDNFWRAYNSEVNIKEDSIWTFVNRVFGDPSTLIYPDDYDFAAPFNPKRTFYQYIRWEANDPLVHYTVADLTDQSLHTNKIQWDINHNGPVARLNGQNRLADHYRPWGGNPVDIAISQQADSAAYLPSVKDPWVTRSDDWDFPSAEPLSVAMLGRVHRGTPWQTVYLKSAGVDPNVWQQWSGIMDHSAALAAVPTNDWRLATWLGLILNTNDPRQLLSINNPDTNVWLEVLDGLTVITNSSPPLELIMSSNSPQAAAIAAAIQQARSAQPGGQFNHIGDILTTPQLSLGSPWLDPSGLSGLYEPTSDETCEILPSQLLSRLREDSLGSITSAAGQLQVQFSGYDHFGYAVQVSSNLVDWVAVSTNYPSYGAFSFSIVAPPASSQQFYRTALLP